VLFLISVLERLVSMGATIEEIAHQQQTSRQMLHSLHHCMTEMHKSVRKMKRSSKVVIDHLGLDMLDAWKDLYKVISSCPAGDIECHVLIMTDDPNELGPEA